MQLAGCVFAGGNTDNMDFLKNWSGVGSSGAEHPAELLSEGRQSLAITSCLVPLQVGAFLPLSRVCCVCVCSAARASGGHGAGAALSFQAFSRLLSRLAPFLFDAADRSAFVCSSSPRLCQIKGQRLQLFSLFWCSRGRGPINPEGMLSPGRRKGHSPLGEPSGEKLPH